ncbi:protein ripply2 isoform X1 [Monodelphis domestica]|uniref:protein ripply2 isoform X1 n=1 Tax=Monodelphis domestica TaxID=13616 RepID=UPI0004435363|nr:protein ripply2 isoform X1 [Monodelphis domestica]
MESLESSEPRPEWANCCRLLPETPASQTPSPRNDNSGSTAFWRPWLGTAREEEKMQPNQKDTVCDVPGMTETSGKLSQYKHPVRLFWPKSKCYDFLYQEAESLLKNFPIQATISFYEDSDSEDEEEELIQDSGTELD